MTNIIRTHYVVCLLLAFMMISISTVAASEVTGTLSSDASSTSTQSSDGDLTGTVESGNTLTGTVTSDPTSGNLAGTVVGGSTSGGSGGGSSQSGSTGGGSTSGESTTSTPPGAVLGTTTDAPTTPMFPRTGFAPIDATPTPTLWSAMITLLGKILPF